MSFIYSHRPLGPTFSLREKSWGNVIDIKHNQEPPSLWNLMQHSVRVNAPTTRRGRMQGFTMIELIMTIVIIGIMSAVVMPKLNLLSGYDEAIYRDKVKAAIEYARRSAIAQRRVSCVDIASNIVTLNIELITFDTSGAGVCSTANIHTLSLPISDSRCASGVTNEVCPPSNVTLTSGTTSTVTIHFDAQGQPLNLSDPTKLLGTNTIITVTNSSTGDATSLIVYEGSGYVDNL